MKKTSTATLEQRLEDKNFGLSPEAFQQLLKTLKAGEDEMYQRVFLAHFEDCLRYLKVNYQASHRNAYDASMDALVTFCGRLKEDRIQYGNLRFLFTRMAAQNYLKIKRDYSRIAELDEEWDIVEEPDIDLPPDALATFEEAWNQLGDNCKKLLKSFFYDRVKLKDIAAELNKREASLRKQKQRCVNKLQAIFHDLYQ
jgi:DNA-directed RNA polymerase specialized sigma24 family protein